MSSTSLVLFLSVIIALATLPWLRARGWPTPTLSRIALAAACIGGLVLCIFGFIASFEPSRLAVPARMLYGALAALAIIGARSALTHTSR